MAPSTDLQPYYSQQLQWQSFADTFDIPELSDRFQTAELTVPIDYDNPALGDTNVVMYRQVAARSSEGAVVLNPGGPGGGGEFLVLDADFIFERPVLRARDIVSFDPRGVGRSNPIVCRTPAQLDADAQLVPGSDEAIVAGERFRQECAAGNPDLLPHVDTSNVARDLDVMRAALGQPTLDYLGFSYGTEIGQR